MPVDRGERGRHTSNEEIIGMLVGTRTVAVVGASEDESKAANAIPRYLQEQGYRVLPVNPRGGQILGEHVYRSLSEIELPIDVVDVFRPPAEAKAVAQAAIDAGARALWFQPGTSTEEAAQLAVEAGLDVVTGLCMAATHASAGLSSPVAARHSDRAEQRGHRIREQLN